jgi:methylthioribulose-1-phosphate dehydratase
MNAPGLYNRRVPSFEEIATAVCGLGRACHGQGWVPATSGNFSAVVSREPRRLAITPSGADKGHLEPQHILEIDGAGRVVRGSARPSAETAIHLAIVRARDAGAVAHTHSLNAALLSEAYAADGHVTLQGYEMLKALDGVTTHEHTERVPIIDNTQDWQRAAPAVEAMLAENPDAHGFLIRGHGLYTWGRDANEALRHVEALEYLLEASGRS